jgi:hypothetical protein
LKRTGSGSLQLNGPIGTVSTFSVNASAGKTSAVSLQVGGSNVLQLVGGGYGNTYINAQGVTNHRFYAINGKSRAAIGGRDEPNYVLLVAGNADATPVLGVRRSSATQTADLVRVMDDTGAALLQVLPTGQVKVSAAANQATGGGAAALGANSPAANLAAPFTWFKVIAADGSQVYVPAWK